MSPSLPRLSLWTTLTSATCARLAWVHDTTGGVLTLLPRPCHVSHLHPSSRTLPGSCPRLRLASQAADV